MSELSFDHRNTPQEGSDVTPAQRLMGRRTKTLLPTAPSLLEPRTVDACKTAQQREHKQAKMCAPYEARRPLPQLSLHDTVRMQPIDGSPTWKEATVIAKVPNNPRSYVVQDNNGAEYRRDRQFLRHKPDKSIPQESSPTHVSSPETFYTPPEKIPPLACTNKEPPSDNAEPTAHDTPKTTRSGRIVKVPIRYK